MKKIKAHKISSLVLWICMLVTLVTFGFFYADYTKGSDITSGIQTDWILICLYSIFFISCFSVLFFSVYQLIKGGKDYFRKVLHSLISIVMLILLLFVTYQIGSGEPLAIPGYQGNENTYYWLKISDMWIYSIFVLLGLTILSILVGIIWSYLKKR